MSWFRRKKQLRSYFWLLVVLVRDSPFETRLIYGITYAKPGDSAMSLYHDARNQIEKSEKSFSGCPTISFTVIPNDL